MPTLLGELMLQVKLAVLLQQQLKLQELSYKPRQYLDLFYTDMSRFTYCP